ncbi:recombinase family protein [Candidatus Tisiphia endosymbiont of Temnostethus pusillus]|uniref:recombinase family protein n=1 Tax=Candidatus Tisiphia endosymbiont of Temnostethus pusillus TaxID=3139335 RepID=UPI0035C8CB76
MIDRYKATKAIILSRVSSKDQQEGYSLEVQTDRLEKYCERNGLFILDRFKLVESSTKGDRKHFMEIIKFIRKQREPIAFVADKVDRIQRSQKETPILDDLIRQGKLELHFNSEGYVIHQHSSAHELMMWGMSVVFAKSHTDLLSENVRKSFKQKIEVHGEWYGPAPIGYINKRDERGRGLIVVDPVSGPIIKKIFETYATGVYTLSEMVAKAKEWGLRSKKGFHFTKSPLHRLLQNPFYYGEMRIKEELWPHKYEPLTTREIFMACEAVRNGWNKTPFQYRGKEFLFRGILKCAVTDKLITADTKTKRYKNGKVSEWTYLRTWNPQNPEKMIWIREEQIVLQLEEVLKSLKIKDPEILKQTMEYLMNVNHGKAHEFNREVGALKQEHTQIQNKLDSIVDLVTEGVLTREEFLRKKTQLRDRQYELSELIKSYDKVDDKLSKKLVDLISITTNAYKTFRDSTIAEKRELLNFMFANLNLNGSNLEYTLAFPFTELAKLTNCPIWRGVVDNFRTTTDIKLLVIQAITLYY